MSLRDEGTPPEPVASVPQRQGSTAIDTTGDAANAFAEKTSPATRIYYLRIPEGQDFGPIDARGLEQWIREGRVSHDCSIYDGRAWVRAGEWIPELEPAATPPPVKPLFPPSSSSSEYRFVLPHRGRMIFALAMVGMMLWFPIPSIMAWLMGSGDLAQIDHGLRDPAGRTLTVWGRNLGVIASLVWGLAVLVALVFLISWSRNFA